MRLNNWCGRYFNKSFRNYIYSFSFLCGCFLCWRFFGYGFLRGLLYRFCIDSFFSGCFWCSLLRGLLYRLWLFRLNITFQPIAFSTSANAVGLLLNHG